MKQILYKYRHAWILLYFPVYMLWFIYLERTVTVDSKYYLMHIELDDVIPFCEVFIIPYLLWFLYILTVGLYFFFTNVRDFYRFCIFLFLGMSVSLLICTIFPNGQNLRPDLDSLGRDNLFITLIERLYLTDTPTNVFPSIHVLNSVGACIAIFHSQALKSKTWIRALSLVLSISICCSTVFLKQHSCLDLLGGLLLSLLMYCIAYKPKMEKIPERINEPGIPS